MLVHPAYKLKFETGATSHVGRVRTNNEDSFVARPEVGVWAVADGVGGYEAGEVASGMVAEALATVGKSASHGELMSRFEAKVEAAHAQIRAYSDENEGRMMGTTVAGLVIKETTGSCLWAGDSRVYRVRNGIIQQISRDHSEVQELLDRGAIGQEEAKTWPRKNVITRAVGIFDAPNLEVRTGEVAPGDLFVLCTDGLTNHVLDDEIAAYANGQKAQRACDSLVDLTLQRGATDNVTVVMVRCHRAEKTNYHPR
jgi:serine/threonine protein phosphatase PrpC